LTNKKQQYDKTSTKVYPKVAVTIPALNEEKIIGETISSLKSQILTPYRIIVVNDGSTDKTEEIIKSFSGVEIVNRKPHESYVGKKELATTFNAGLEQLRNDDKCNYIMILGSDVILPKNYLLEITKRMNENPKIAISSGMIKDEYSITPRGAGRVVRYEFWKKLGLEYPINYGFEGYLILKAKSLGYEVKTYEDLTMITKRKTGQKYDSNLYYYYGLGLKALGYSIPYALGRIMILGKKTPKGALKMLQGFSSNYDQLYEPELRKYVKQSQRNNLFHINKNFLKNIFQLIKHS
jgi:glycosyltransferase involved in cell wall biosynthesis